MEKNMTDILRTKAVLDFAFFFTSQASQGRQKIHIPSVQPWKGPF